MTASQRADFFDNQNNVLFEDDDEEGLGDSSLGDIRHTKVSGYSQI
jgi:hypothetical protein